jgi:hypothetical protein
VEVLLHVIANDSLHCLEQNAKRKAQDIASHVTCGKLCSERRCLNSRYSARRVSFLDRCAMTIFEGSW